MKKEIALFLVLTLLVPGCMGDSEPMYSMEKTLAPQFQSAISYLQIKMEILSNSLSLRER